MRPERGETHYSSLQDLSAPAGLLIRRELAGAADGFGLLRLNFKLVRLSEARI